MRIKTNQITQSSTTINKVYFSDVEDLFEALGINADIAFQILADEKECIYVSTRFVEALERGNVEEGEWHHYFVKDTDGRFTAEKFNFCNN